MSEAIACPHDHASPGAPHLPFGGSSALAGPSHFAAGAVCHRVLGSANMVPVADFRNQVRQRR
jgi:hypothetical protein